jgi:hypothetical protein
MWTTRAAQVLDDEQLAEALGEELHNDVRGEVKIVAAKNRPRSWPRKSKDALRWCLHVFGRRTWRRPALRIFA